MWSNSLFGSVRELSDVSKNVLKRYLHDGESEWSDIITRVVDYVITDKSDDYGDTYNLILNRYFVPNSPCLVNSGNPSGGLAACFVVDFPDSIEGIFKTKLDFALIAQKGGGCGTTLSNIRPKGSHVSGSTHGYAGGPVNFFNTICHDMDIMTQGGFRAMAMMGTMSVYHPDILEFITSKEVEGKLHTTNISVVVDDSFMERVENDEGHQTFFIEGEEIVLGPKYMARELFSCIVEHAWRNGEPGILFQDRMDDSPYKYSKQKVLATNPCGEQPLPFNGMCNLGSLDMSKFVDDDLKIPLEKLELAVRLGVRFLDSVIDRTSYPTKGIEKWSKQNRPVGLGIMGFADYLLKRGVVYGSEQSVKELTFFLKFVYAIAEDESIRLGKKFGAPKACRKLPTPRRNVTLLTVAPTGSTSLIAGCNESIEPFFSDTIFRIDSTGKYEMSNNSENESFRCAISSVGDTDAEVTWEDHVRIQATAQSIVDSGVSKTINFRNDATMDDISNALIAAWSTKIIKGVTVYRNGSRNVEVLTTQKPESFDTARDNSCPICGMDLVRSAGCSSCPSPACTFSKCDI